MLFVQGGGCSEPLFTRWVAQNVAPYDVGLHSSDHSAQESSVSLPEQPQPQPSGLALAKSLPGLGLGGAFQHSLDEWPVPDPALTGRGLRKAAGIPESSWAWGPCLLLRRQEELNLHGEKHQRCQRQAGRKEDFRYWVPPWAAAAVPSCLPYF